MSTHRRVEVLCVACAIVACLICTVAYALHATMGKSENAGHEMSYEQTLFDTSKVHTIDIVMDDWDKFIENCENEEYATCAVVVDGESFKNVAIRGKGNTSLSNVSQLDSDRYSFKVEFDHYESSRSYHGLDKLSLNNIIQDNTYMKDYLTYRMMGQFGVDAPLASYVNITVNGEDWGLYLAVEGVEDSFLERLYGTEKGELYKPDSMGFGGGRGNGRDFDMNEFMKEQEAEQDGEGDMPSFGGQQGTSSPSGDSSTGSDSRPMVDWIFTDEKYTQAYHELYQQFLNEIDVQALIDETEALISPYVERDPTKFCTFEEFQTGVNTLREFCALRTQSVQGQLDGTIPATEEGQQEDSSSLVDASGLTISAMGSMGNRGGGDAPQQGGGQQSSQLPSGEGFDLSNFNPSNFNPSTMTDLAPPNGGARTAVAASPQAWIVLVVSVILLAGGMGVALIFRR